MICGERLFRSGALPAPVSARTHWQHHRAPTRPHDLDETHPALSLFSRLLLAHSLPVALVTFALALTLLALTRMTGLLEEVTTVELRTLQTESEIHQASWGVDSALGHAYTACHAGSQRTERAQGEVARASATLAERLAAAPALDPSLARMAKRWLALAGDATRDQGCSVLGSDAFRTERDTLDDQLTDLWSRRLAELHAGVAKKDVQARAIGSTALHAGGLVAVAASILALLLARRMAKTLSDPLKNLTDTARRVGAGDFSTKIHAGGPSEFVTLGSEFERMRERLEQLEQLKQGFLASVSHELRTPLSKLREALALLDDGVVGPLSTEQSRVLAIARGACERQIRLVTTLLDVSRLRAGSPLRPRATNIDDIVRRAVAEESAEVAGRGVRVELDLQGASPVCSVDGVLLERSVANLVRNALAVSQPGQTVRVCRDSILKDGARSLCITVVDQGPGVPEDIRDTVFNAFVTSVVPRSPKALGVGLGLALAREVAVAHGGDLLLDSATGEGAVFRLLLPWDAGDPRAKPANATPPKLLGIDLYTRGTP